MHDRPPKPPHSNARPPTHLVEKYFSENPGAKDGVMKACYAWHDDIPAPKRHEFEGSDRQSKCINCNRTREEVRYDELPPQCGKAKGSGEVGFHYFGGSAPWATCVHCGKTRENLDDSIQSVLRGHGFKLCPSYRPIEIAEVIRKEEDKAYAHAERAKQTVPKHIKKLGMSGQTLAFLHRTHGFDIETVSSVFDVQPDAAFEYEQIMENERSMSRRAFRPKPIQAA